MGAEVGRLVRWAALRAQRPRRLALPALVSVLGLLVPATGWAQEAQGRIIGQVISEATGEPVSGANVMLAGTSFGALTNVDGRYLLRQVEPGLHTIIVQVIGFAVKEVTGVQVTAGGTAHIDISLATEAVSLGRVTASATVERGSTTALTNERRRAGVVVDAIGADQIARSPDGDAAAVLARAPGVSIVGDGNVYVRGLGDRYGAVTLNGTPMASAQPDRKTVPLDIIPSSFLESVVTAKTYSPDQPGDYAGGLVQIRTRDFPATSIAKVSGSVAYNPTVSLRQGLGTRAGAYDFLAFDDGTRALPVSLPDQRITAGNFSAEELESMGEHFGGAWGPAPRAALPLDQGFSLALGGRTEWFGEDVPAGYLLAVTQSTSYGNRQDLVERVLGGGDRFEADFAGTATTRSASLGGMLNFSVEPTEANRLTLSALYNRSADDEARNLQGYNHDFSTNQRNYRLRYLAQELMTAQLEGEHELGLLSGTRLAWRADVSKAGRYEPDTRELLYRQVPDGRYLFETFVQSGSVFHSDLDENGYGAGVDVRVPLELREQPASLAFGGAADFKERDSYARRFRFLPEGALSEVVRERDPNELFDPVTIGPDMFQISEATFEGDNYRAGQAIAAGYAMLDAEVLPRVRLVAGARVERATQSVNPLERFTQTMNPLPGASLDDTDVLPGINLTVRASDAMNVRLGLSRTVARPQFRELAPFKFTDYVGGFLTIGNPALERSTIDNYDVRWEWFPDLGSLVAVSAFYKRFRDPIESVVLTSTELMQTWINADGAEVKGLELELRTGLGFLGEALAPLALNANGTWIESEVDQGGTVRVFLPFGEGVSELSRTDRSRALQGQSPWMANASLSWADPDLGTSLSVLYNHFGRRIDTVGDTQLPDIYEEGRGSLDLVLDHTFGRGISATLSAERLLGSEVEFTQGGHVVRSYDEGRVLSFSVAWDLGG